MTERIALRYQFSPGERQRHRQTITLVLEMPDGSRAGSRVISDIEQLALECLNDRALVEFRQSLISREGSLADTMPQQLIDGTARCWLGLRGELLEHMDTPAPAPTASFPEHEVAPGDLWSVEQRTPAGPPLRLDFRLEKVENGVAHLVSHSLSPAGADGGTSEVRGNLQFSLDQGCPLESTTVIVTQYPDGRKVNQVIQSRRID